MPKVCGRPKNFNELIIKNLKYIVAKQDVLIHLGDVIADKFNELKPMLDQIVCKSKILIRGNHDKKTNNWYINNGFDFCCDSLVIGDVALSHKPLRILPEGVRINIHGHFHNFDFKILDKECGDYHNPEIHKLLALEYTDYKPVNLLEFN